MVHVEHNGSALKITFVGDNGFRESALNTNRTLNSNTSLSVSLEITFLIDGLNSKDLRAVQYHPIYVVVMSTDHNTDEHAYLDLVTRNRGVLQDRLCRQLWQSLAVHM